MKKLHLFILSCCLTFCAIPVFSQNRELEPNDGFSTANPLSFDTELKGTSISRNVDFFKITVSKPMVLTITVNGVTLGQSIEAELYDPTLKFIDSKFASNGTILLNQLVCSVGVYYIKLHSVAGSSDYTLKVKSDASDVYECNNTFNDATGIPFDKAIKASINSAGDVDFYKVNMLKPAVLNIAVENVPSDQKMYVFLYDSKQEYLGKETASDNGKNVYFSQLGCGGTYYIKVYSINNVANNAQYTLKVNADASDIYECNNSFNDAKQIGSNSELKASINTADDVDFYKITITKPTDINVSVEGVDASQSMSIEMYDDKQIKLGRAFGNKGMNIFYNQLVCSSGTYYIKLFSLGGPSASQYTMKVKADPFQPTITTSNGIICIGSSTTLTASACTGGTLSWTGGLTGSSITVSPTATKSYKVLCTRGGCKSDSSIATSVTVLPKPIAPTISSNINCAIPVTKQWDKTLKGNGSENVRVMLALANGGYILGGENQSTLTNSLDYWLVKIDANGNKVWEKTFGGTKDENLASMVVTNDGGYVLFGYSNSDISGDKSEAPRGLNDYWVIKVNANGTKVWDKTFGGIAHDIPKSIVAASDGGFLLGGQSLSGLNGDKSEASKGTYDYWVVKINANGAKLWDKSFGGDGEENFSSMVLTNDGGFVLGGYSSSGISGNKSETARGASDYWVVKINSTGTKVWDKTFGGSSVDILSSIVYTADGGFLLGGGTLSTLSGDKSESSRGDFDYWVVKLNPNGIKLWDKTFGGNNVDYFRSMVSTNDGGVLLAGDSFSGVGNEKSEASKGNMDYWIVKVNASGVKVWDKSFGGNNNDFLTNIVLTNDGGFLVSGSSLSGLSGDKTDVGTQSQYCWLVKASVCNPNNISSSQKPTLTATGCTGTVTWSNGVAGNSITVSPSTTTIYTATCTVNSCLSATSNAITVTVPVKPKTPTITASNTSICGGTSATLTASACDGGTLSWTGGLTGSSIIVTPITTKAYKVVCTQQGVISDSSAAKTITVIPKPTQPKITASNTSICVGSSAVLTASACTGGTLSWTGGLTGSSITVSPTATKSYKVLCTQSGCKSDSSVATTIAVMAKPAQPKITASNTSICAGSSSVLTASACTGGTLTWTGGLTGSSITVSPTASKSYKVLCTQGGCKSDSSVATTITVIAKPSQPKITASNTSICVGSSVVLTASACTGGTLSWTGGLTGTSITVSPTVIKSYKVLCTQGGCKSDSSVATTITVIAKPTQPKITASNTSICVGSSAVLTASACTGGTLSWTGGLTGSSITVSPTVSKSYKVLCTQSGCKSDSSVATTIAVIAKPTQPKITASNTSICVGTSTVLTASACTGGTLSWTGGLTGSSITVSPTVTKSYKVLCTQGGCKSDSSVATTITVIAKPSQPKITASNTSICVGSSAVLTASACTGGTLSWTGGLTGSSITVSPTVTKSYKVLCTQGGCKSDSSVVTTITVIAKPTQPKITASNTSICVGSSATLTASACTGGTLSWTGGLTGSSITVSPTATKSYKVLCTQSGCKSDSSVATTIAVMAKPIQPKITATNTSICVGTSTVLTASACTGGTLSWTGGLTGSSITVSPTVTKSYKVLCTQGGCKSDSSIATTITVIAKPTQPKITASNTSICAGSSSVLTASACIGGTLSWTGGLTGSSITVSPTVTKSYKVLCMQGGCKSDSSLATTITIITKPTQPKITVSNTSICAGSSSVLTASACTGGTLTWTGGLTGSSITVSPTVTKSYKVLCTQGGCKSDSSVATTVTVLGNNECNNSFTNASEFIMDNDIKVTFKTDGPKFFYYKLNLKSPSSLKASLKGIANYLIYIEIFDENFKSLDREPSSNLTTDNLFNFYHLFGNETGIDKILCAGLYYVKITYVYQSLSVNNNFESYNLKFSTYSLDNFEPNNSFSEAQKILLGSEVKATIGCQADEDFYKITINKNRILNVSCITKSEQYLVFELFDNKMNSLGSMHSAPSQTTIYYSKLLCEGGVYYLKLSGHMNYNSQYSLKVTTDSSDIYECNNSFSEAKEIPFKSNIKGAIYPSDDKDFFKFTLKSKSSVNFNITEIPSGMTVYMDLYNQNQSFIIRRVNLNNTSSIEKMQLTEGTYYVRISSDQFNPSLYNLVVNPEICTLTSRINTPNGTSFCSGSSINIIAEGLGTTSPFEYKWKKGDVVIGSEATLKVSEKSTYTVEIADKNGCVVSSSVSMTEIPKPSQPKITTSNTSICVGSSTVLTASACTGGTLTWTGGLTGSSITVSPTASKSYKVLCTQAGCKSDSSAATTIIVIPKPNQPKITASNTTICVGTSTVLTASACTGGTLTWTGGLTGSSITVSPTASKSYKVLCTQGGCKSDSSVATTITVIAKPTQPKITASNTSICVGSSTVLTASACTGGTLSWTGGLTGSSITVSPTASKSYKVLCTQSGCKSDSSVATTIAVIAKPTQPKITASNTSICVGSSTILTASGCNGGTLSWTGGLTGSSITVSPTVIKSYKVLCTQSGCKSDSSLATTIAVMAKPTQPKITASNTSICVGTSTVLTASACTGGTLTWTGSLTGSSITVSPTVTKSYKVLCTQSGCKSDSSVATTIAVIAKPSQPKITVSNTSICAGSSSVLTASACTGGTLSWTGGLTGSSITVSPTVTKSYKVLCTQGGCKSDSSLATTITIITKPTQPKITASNTSICSGSSSVLTASACTGGTLTWTGGLTGSSITVSPTVIKSYKVLCTQSGCKSDSSVATTIAVMAKPTQPKITTSNTSICVGSSTVLTASACTGGTLTWTGGLTGSSITVSPTASKSYKVLCTQAGCKSDSSAATTITVITKPTQPKITTSNSIICIGSSTTLTSSACTGGTLSWTGGLTGNSITVSPTATKSYKVLCTQGGCKSDSSIAVTIAVMAKPSQPKITASNTSICVGSSAVLTASACTGGTLTWTGGLTGSSITVSPTVIKSYKVLCTQGSCKSDSSLATTIAVMAKPTQPKITASNTSICVGSSAVLTASACTGGTLSWTGGLTGSSITVSPTASKSYKVLCTQSGCKSDSSVATTITVIAKPSQPKITASNTSICVGSSAVLTASACTGGTLSWTGGLTGSSITVSPTATKSYKVLCMQGGCKSDSSLATTITIITKPTQPKITVSNTSICAGSSSVLTASACTGGTLSWTGGLTGSSITVSPTKTIAYKVLCTIGGCKSDSSLATTVTVLPKPNAPSITSQPSTVSSVVKQWEKTFGGDWYDYLSCIVPTQDGGYLLGGNSTSTTISGDKSEDIVGGWIVKINADGKKIWDKAYKDIFVGANGTRIGLSSIVPTSDGGFLLGGTSTVYTGGIDYWIIKINANGSRIWDKTFGGIAEDYLVKIISTSDGGFLIGGSSYSGTNGYLDYLVVKVDANGNKQWSKFFGAAGHETLSSIIKTSDGGYLLAGDSHSNIGGDKSENSKGLYSSDYWIVKIDASGNKMWDKTLGGDNNDASPDVVLTPDGGFLVGGSSRSRISGDKSENYRGDIGYDDFWIVKLDSKGTKIWDKTFGGSMNDKLIKIIVTPDGGFLLGGASYSGIGVDKSEDTQGHWLIKINANGQKIWDKTLGGIGTEAGIYDLLPTSDGGYIFGSSSRSVNAQMDYWLVKIKESKTTTSTLTATGCSGTVTWSNGATGNSITVSPSTATTYTATCTVNGCVSIASNSINVSASTNARIASIDENTENTDMDKDSKPMINFRVFPNPAKDKLTIQTDLEGEVTFQLYNDLGQKVLESSFVKQVVLPVGNLNRQAHYYLIQHDNKQFTGKVFLE